MYCNSFGRNSIAWHISQVSSRLNTERVIVRLPSLNTDGETQSMRRRLAARAMPIASVMAAERDVSLCRKTGRRR